MSRRVPVFVPETETQKGATGKMAASLIDVPQVSVVFTFPFFFFFFVCLFFGGVFVIAVVVVVFETMQACFGSSYLKCLLPMIFFFYLF
jgi:hypothetical protein